MYLLKLYVLVLSLFCSSANTYLRVCMYTYMWFNSKSEGYIGIIIIIIAIITDRGFEFCQTLETQTVTCNNSFICIGEYFANTLHKNKRREIME